MKTSANRYVVYAKSSDLRGQVHRSDPTEDLNTGTETDFLSDQQLVGYPDMAKATQKGGVRAIRPDSLSTPFLCWFGNIPLPNQLLV